MGQGASDAAGGMAHGLAAICGLGSEFDPMQDLRSELATAKENLQAIKDQGAYTALQEQNKINQQFVEMIQTQNKVNSQSTRYYNDIALDGIKQTDLFMVILTLLVIVIIFFMLAK